MTAPVMTAPVFPGPPPALNAYSPVSASEQKSVADRAESAGKAKDAAALKQASAEMESLFLYQLLEVMRETVPETGFMSGGAGETTFRSLMHMALAKDLASAGGLGLGDMLYDRLAESLLLDNGTDHRASEPVSDVPPVSETEAMTEGEGKTGQSAPVSGKVGTLSADR